MDINTNTQDTVVLEGRIWIWIKNQQTLLLEYKR